MVKIFKEKQVRKFKIVYTILGAVIEEPYGGSVSIN